MAGGFALRSMTDSLLSGDELRRVGRIELHARHDECKQLVGSDCDTLWRACHARGRIEFADHLGRGDVPRSMIATVSWAGFGGTVLAPLTSTALASLADRASCAAAPRTKTTAT